MCKCRVPALRDQDDGPTASWGLGQARQMSCQGSDLTDILGACFRKSSCSQLAWQCFCAGADPAASMLVLRRRQQVSSSPTCRDLPASPGSARHHQWAGMAGASPSVPPFDAVTLCVRGTRITAGERECKVGGESALWPLKRVFGSPGICSRATPVDCLTQNIKVVLQPDPWSKDVGFFVGKCPEATVCSTWLVVTSG